jgi:hypothetical protein
MRDDANRVLKSWGAHFAEPPRLVNGPLLVQAAGVALHHCQVVLAAFYDIQRAQRRLPGAMKLGMTVSWRAQ